MSENREWQPIETAPKEGTMVLVFHKHWGHEVAWLAKGDWFSSAGWIKNAPTHWMHLPEPPK